ncbi:MAG: alpha/beta fold hydrolase [Ketobacter sp.]|nr:MAG: alpha/beta fold hydrolase [Ketobacter sp.]
MPLSSSARPVASPSPAKRHTSFHWLFGLFTLAMRSGGELTRVAGEMHHTVTAAPMPWDAKHQADFSKAPKVYKLVKLVFEYGSDSIHQWVNRLPGQTPASGALVRMRSALNGVVGDKLVEWDHLLAMGMETVDELGNDIQLSQLNLQKRKSLVLFVHGLCLSEHDWQGPGHSELVAKLREQGHQVAWIRYNTGLPIWENGRQLAELLDQYWTQTKPRKSSITMIGHSMGGLVIRSANHYAEKQRHAWLVASHNAAYLASPHAGAPLEKIGNFSNSMLGATPYSKPLMALGNIRSRGIRSLRHANVTEPEHENAPQPWLPMSDKSHHLLVGARRFYESGNRWLGDGLVPEDSAMGGPYFPQQHPNVERVMLDQVGHLALLQDHRMYVYLQRWLIKRGVLEDQEGEGKAGFFR